MGKLRDRLRDSQISVRMNADCAALAPLISELAIKHDIVPRTVVRIALANIAHDMVQRGRS